MVSINLVCSSLELSLHYVAQIFLARSHFSVVPNPDVWIEGYSWEGWQEGRMTRWGWNALECFGCFTGAGFICLPLYLSTEISRHWISSRAPIWFDLVFDRGACNLIPRIVILIEMLQRKQGIQMCGIFNLHSSVPSIQLRMYSTTTALQRSLSISLSIPQSSYTFCHPIQFLRINW